MSNPEIDLTESETATVFMILASMTLEDAINRVAYVTETDPSTIDRAEFLGEIGSIMFKLQDGLGMVDEALKEMLDEDT